MLTHRFRDFFRTSPVAPAEEPTACAFVPCPMLHAFSSAQLAQIQEIYRLAAEQTRVQLQPRRTRGIPSFSRN
jgi:hypothetical protein